jgi:queuine/archaeosine tRNA-ribosyltransferase
MGVGYPLDLVVCVALGVDMFDCVWPCMRSQPPSASSYSSLQQIPSNGMFDVYVTGRTARFGTAIVPEGLLQLRRSRYANDETPIDATCTCSVCRKYSRAYLHTLITKEPIGCHLLTIHNIHAMMSLMKQMRAAISDGVFPQFVDGFLLRQFPAGDVPRWVVDALREAGLDIPVGKPSTTTSSTTPSTYDNKDDE